MSVMLLQQKVKDERLEEASAAVRDLFATLDTTCSGPGARNPRLVQVDTPGGI